MIYITRDHNDWCLRGDGNGDGDGVRVRSPTSSSLPMTVERAPSECEPLDQLDAPDVNRSLVGLSVYAPSPIPALELVSRLLTAPCCVPIPAPVLGPAPAPTPVNVACELARVPGSSTGSGASSGRMVHIWTVPSSVPVANIHASPAPRFHAKAVRWRCPGVPPGGLIV
jgi:hypothetical protein